MKIAIACSLQGSPEEPIAHRVGRFLKQFLAQDYPGHSVELYERSDYLGQGDAYLAIARDINRWRADLAVHIHADASWDRNAYGFSVLYCTAHSLSLAEYVLASMAHELIPRGYTRSRGLSQRCDVAVLKRATMPACLVEVGFYTNPHELSLLQLDWYCALVAQSIRVGINGWIGRKLGVGAAPQPITDAKGGDHIMLPSPVGNYHIFPDVWISRYNNWLHIKEESMKENSFQVIVTRRDGTYFTALQEPLRACYDRCFDLNDLLRRNGVTESCSVAVSSALPTACYIREW